VFFKIIQLISKFFFQVLFVGQPGKLGTNQAIDVIQTRVGIAF
jgi:hypothetical protein